MSRSRGSWNAVIFLGLTISVAVGASGQKPPGYAGQLARLADTYSLELVTSGWAFPVETRHGAIDGRDADREELDNYLGLFIEEFTLYPPDFVSRSRLNRIVFCRKLSFAAQLRTAIPHFESDTLYLDVERGRRHRGYVRKVIHHEFFHIVDLRDDGQLYTDEAWASLNPAEFAYGTGGRHAQELRTTSVFTDQFPGFLNHYSTTAVEEDKAEVFANLMVEPGYVTERVERDEVLRAKVERMKQLLVRFSPDMDEAFWERVRQHVRTAP